MWVKKRLTFEENVKIMDKLIWCSTMDEVWSQQQQQQKNRLLVRVSGSEPGTHCTELHRFVICIIHISSVIFVNYYSRLTIVMCWKRICMYTCMINDVYNSLSLYLTQINTTSCIVMWEVLVDSGVDCFRWVRLSIKKLTNVPTYSK